jgi:hypothetical protein
MNYNCGCVYVNGNVVLAEGHDELELKAVATGGRAIPSEICPLPNEPSLDACLGAESKRVGIVLTEGDNIG